MGMVEVLIMKMTVLLGVVGFSQIAIGVTEVAIIDSGRL